MPSIINIISYTGRLCMDTNKIKCSTNKSTSSCLVKVPQKNENSWNALSLMYHLSSEGEAVKFPVSVCLNILCVLHLFCMVFVFYSPIWKDASTGLIVWFRASPVIIEQSQEPNVKTLVAAFVFLVIPLWTTLIPLESL